MAIAQLESPLFKAVYAAGATSGTPGEALDSGLIYIYTVGGTYSSSSDQATVWSDKAKTSVLSQPISLDASGEKEIWFDGTYDIRVESSTTELQSTVTGIQSTVGAASATTTASILNNGSFESDSDADGAPDNWTLAPETSAVIATDTTNVTDGLKSLKFAGGGAGGGTATSDKFAVTEGEAVEVVWSFYATHDTTTNTVQIKWYDEDDVLQSTATLATMPASGAVPTSWTRYYERVAVDAAGTQGEVILTGIGSGGSNLSEDAYFDGITITLVTDLEPVVYDSAGKAVIKTAKTASAVNEVTATNAATGNSAQIKGSGETNAGLEVTTSGTGVLDLNTGGTGVVQVSGTPITHTGKGYGGAVLLDSQTAANSAFIVFESLLTATYKKYWVELINVVPATNTEVLLSQVGTGGTPTYQTGSVYTSESTINTTPSQMGSTLSSTADRGGLNGDFYIYAPADGVTRTSMSWVISTMNSTDSLPDFQHSGQQYEATTAVTALKFIMGSGNITSGEFRLYGMIV